MDIFEEDVVLNNLFDEVSKYDFDIENLAFEGGGAKMAAYFGVVKVSVCMVYVYYTQCCDR